jgi:outer membrane protein
LKLRTFPLSLLLFLLSATVQAKDPDAGDLPLWQAGIFAIHISNPSYPGADTTQKHSFVLPAVTYRGKILRADENESPRARFFRSDMSELDISAAAYFSSDSEGTAREGMPDLDYVGELGPRFNWWWIRNKEMEVRSAFPIRSVFSTDFARFRTLGSSFTPTFYLDFKKLPVEGFQFFTSLSFQFLDRGAAGYFFNVDPAFVRADRSAYQVQSGYMGESLSTRVVWKIGRTYTSFGVSVDDYTRSSFRDSPLLKNRQTLSSFIGIGYDLIDSEARARD